MNSKEKVLAGARTPKAALVESSSKMGTVARLISPLNTEEKKALRRCERIIVRGAAEFVRVGLALRENRDGRLYRDTHSTFEEYCISRFDFHRAAAWLRLGWKGGIAHTRYEVAPD